MGNVRSASYSRQKGARAEVQAKDILNKHMGREVFERTPSSGALDAKYHMKCDLFKPAGENRYTIEVKNYQESQINHLMLGKSPKIIEWWEQTLVGAKGNRNNIPLLLFKHSRSKFYCATEDINGIARYPNLIYNYDDYKIQISLLSDFLKHEQPDL